jgi:hypothetical protein
MFYNNRTTKWKNTKEDIQQQVIPRKKYAHVKEVGNAIKLFNFLLVSEVT